MPNFSGTVTAAQGVQTIFVTPNDVVTFTPTGTYTVEYPVGTVAISASIAALSVTCNSSATQMRILCVSGSVAYALVDNPDVASTAVKSSVTLTNNALHRVWSFGANFSNGGGNNDINMYLGKETIEAGVSAVRVWVYSKDPIAESSGWEVIVGPTDVITNDSTANAFYPQVGGVQGNAIADTLDHTVVANQYGFRRVQWGGQWNDGRASKSGRLRPAANWRNQTPNQGPYFGSNATMVSDWTDIQTVPASDGRHYMVWRAKKAAVIGETNSFCSTDFSPTWKTASAFPWYRRQFVTQSFSGDAIGALTNVGATPTEANYTWQPCCIAFEYRFNVPVRSVAMVGDSIFEGGSYQAYGLNNFMLQAVYALSTPAVPIVPLSMGWSTAASSTFIAQLEQLYASNGRPTDVIIPNVSFNDLGIYVSSGSLTQYLLSQCQARLMRAVNMIRANGGRPFVCTDFHGLQTGTQSAQVNLFHASMYAFTLAQAAAGAFTVVDFRKNWPATIGIYDDGIHPYQSGINYMASILSVALQTQV